MTKHLYLVKPIESDSAWPPGFWYDCAFGFVVRADSKREARKICSTYCGDEGPDVWFNKSRTTCEEILPEGNSEMILQMFING